LDFPSNADFKIQRQIQRRFVQIQRRFDTSNAEFNADYESNAESNADTNLALDLAIQRQITKNSSNAVPNLVELHKPAVRCLVVLRGGSEHNICLGG